MSTNRTRSMLAATALATGLAAIPVPFPLAGFAGTALAAAQSKTCLIRTYYKTAEMADQVGVRTNCPGVSSSGRTSRHVEVERIEYGESSGPIGGGQAKLPCEFLAGSQERCLNVPLKRP